MPFFRCVTLACFNHFFFLFVHLDLPVAGTSRCFMLLRPLDIGRVSLFSEGIQGADRELTCVEMIDSIETAIEQSVASSADRSIAVIPEGPYVIPVYRP